MNSQCEYFVDEHFDSAFQKPYLHKGVQYLYYIIAFYTTRVTFMEDIYYLRYLVITVDGNRYLYSYNLQISEINKLFHLHYFYFTCFLMAD